MGISGEINNFLSLLNLKAGREVKGLMGRLRDFQTI